MYGYMVFIFVKYCEFGDFKIWPCVVDLIREMERGRRLRGSNVLGHNFVIVLMCTR